VPESLARVSPLNSSAPQMTELVMAFSTLRLQNARAIAAVSARHSITPTDMRALSFVATSGGATPTATSEYLGMTTGSLTTLADRLATGGFLTRTSNPDDRRSIVLRVTERGAAVMSEVNELYVRAFSEAFDVADVPWMRESFLNLAASLGRLAD
jgi:DNA-binding MarR family transcriptional regulator